MASRPKPGSKRRTTLTLPESSLREAERIARSRSVNLSVVVGEALEQGLEERRLRGRADAILEAYREAFHGFSEEELAILDGVILEEPGARSS